MLCPSAPQFAQSTVAQEGLYFQQVIIAAQTSLPLPFSNILVLSFRCAQQNCFKYRRGTLFSCPKSDMFLTKSFVEYKVWEKVDVTEQVWESGTIQSIPMQSLPAAARRVNQWVKKHASKKDFTNLYLSKLQSYFLHHQIEQVWFPSSTMPPVSVCFFTAAISTHFLQAQHDPYKIFIQLVTSNLYITTFLFDFAENYGHIAQVRTNHLFCSIMCAFAIFSLSRLPF